MEAERSTARWEPNGEVSLIVGHVLCCEHRVGFAHRNKLGTLYRGSLEIRCELILCACPVRKAGKACDIKVLPKDDP